MLCGPRAPGRLTKFHYDQRNRRTGIGRVDDAGVEHPWKTILYDADGLPIAETNALGQRTTMDYDRDGHLTARRDPFTSTATSNTSISYDPVGNPIRQVDPVGVVTSFVFDRRNRVITIDMHSGAIVGWAPTGMWSDGIAYSRVIAGPSRT